MRRITDVPRMASHRTLLALDATLQRATGQGLSYFSASSGTDLPPHLRPTLSMHLDEGSVGYGACWYLQFHILTRMVVCRDIYHREWNDAKNALMDCKLWWVCLLTRIPFNMAYGPWKGSKWWQQTRDAAKETLSKETDHQPTLLQPCTPETLCFCTRSPHPRRS